MSTTKPITSYKATAGWDPYNSRVQIYFKNLEEQYSEGDTLAALGPSAARDLRNQLDDIVKALETLGLIDDE